MNFIPELDKVGGKLKEILIYKQTELAKRQKDLPLEELKKALSAQNSAERDFIGALKKSRGLGLIAEVKKASPSAGQINVRVDVARQAKQYEKFGANAISVLTDEKFFSGKLEFIKQIKAEVNLPVLRKDFIFDPYQVYESKLAGADAILLITTILSLDNLRALYNLAHELGLQCLVEAHIQEDLQKALAIDARLIGINARDLQSFEVSLDNFVKLAGNVPPDKLLVAESGIFGRLDALKVKSAGAKAILVGTSLMRADNLEEKIKELKLL
ncbi:MAG: indole-3-glycerol phosphate synthase [Candidatus Magasanikbacteria bacterium CG10_big_fil_rev_8_21_14_0_10_40_10]|uniref:Indole-3-glycerol phosphate synthase n=1 Tax=Candidatus Magasanikbacteria bacterium CG10_big_fil_rev_8_21_14_0_10_40_10 TaxID=1974648 RepID=A0A2M6W4D9_9BACT|nr:MAG: indole-3-glycerol phosphate synthase [Candidatus Magasanikbacteria bacterium CG10_big_fil_rev_8_21_14_0_10_40_10]